MQQAGQEGLALGQGMYEGRAAPRPVGKEKLRLAPVETQPRGVGVGIGSGGMRAPSFQAGHGAQALPHFSHIGPQSLLLAGPCDPQTWLSPPTQEGARSERTVDREPGKVRELRVGSMVLRRGGGHLGDQFLAAMTTERATPPRATAVAPNSHFHGMDCG